MFALTSVPSFSQPQDQGDKKTEKKKGEGKKKDEKGGEKKKGEGKKKDDTNK
jgi:hypothetical protein